MLSFVHFLLMCLTLICTFSDLICLCQSLICTFADLIYKYFTFTCTFGALICLVWIVRFCARVPDIDLFLCDLVYLCLTLICTVCDLICLSQSFICTFVISYAWFWIVLFVTLCVWFGGYCLSSHVPNIYVYFYVTSYPWLLFWINKEHSTLQNILPFITFTQDCNAPTSKHFTDVRYFLWCFLKHQSLLVCMVPIPCGFQST